MTSLTSLWTLIKLCPLLEELPFGVFLTGPFEETSFASLTRLCVKDSPTLCHCISRCTALTSLETTTNVFCELSACTVPADCFANLRELKVHNDLAWKPADCTAVAMLLRTSLTSLQLDVRISFTPFKHLAPTLRSLVLRTGLSAAQWCSSLEGLHFSALTELSLVVSDGDFHSEELGRALAESCPSLTSLDLRRVPWHRLSAPPLFCQLLRSLTDPAPGLALLATRLESLSIRPGAMRPAEWDIVVSRIAHLELEIRLPTNLRTPIVAPTLRSLTLRFISDLNATEVQPLVRQLQAPRLSRLVLSEASGSANSATLLCIGALLCRPRTDFPVLKELHVRMVCPAEVRTKVYALLPELEAYGIEVFQTHDQNTPELRQWRRKCVWLEVRLSA